MIRAATPEDIPRLVEMGARFWAESVYVHRLPPVRPAVIAETLDHMLSSDMGAVFVADHDGVVTGMIGLLCYSHPWTAALVSQELFWWVEPEHRGYDGIRLLLRAEAWARTAGVEHLYMVAPTPDVADLYTRLGYGYLETGYMKAIA